jgi:hypothetical protein
MGIAYPPHFSTKYYLHTIGCFALSNNRENIAMNVLHPQYVVDENRTPKAVLLPVDEWDCVVEDLEELDDIRAFDRAKAGPQDSIPFEQAVREIQERSGE